MTIDKETNALRLSIPSKSLGALLVNIAKGTNALCLSIPSKPLGALLVSIALFLAIGTEAKRTVAHSASFQSAASVARG